MTIRLTNLVVLCASGIMWSCGGPTGPEESPCFGFARGLLEEVNGDADFSYEGALGSFPENARVFTNGFTGERAWFTVCGSEANHEWMAEIDFLIPITEELPASIAGTTIVASTKITRREIGSGAEESHEASTASGTLHGFGPANGQIHLDWVGRGINIETLRLDVNTTQSNQRMEPIRPLQGAFEVLNVEEPDGPHATLNLTEMVLPNRGALFGGVAATGECEGASISGHHAPPRVDISWNCSRDPELTLRFQGLEKGDGIFRGSLVMFEDGRAMGSWNAQGRSLQTR